MTHTLAVIIAITQIIIAGCFVAILVGLAMFAKDLRQSVASLDRLANRLEAKIDPLEQRVTATLADTQLTLEEVRLATAKLGETTQYIGERVREVGTVIKFVTDRVEGPLVKTAGAAAGIKAGLAHLLDGLRKRKEDTPHG